jgi:Flp pilus assembly CpaF family ATPase
MLNAMSQGNDGSMCTVHANSSLGAFGKLAMYAIQAPERLNLRATNLMVATPSTSWCTSVRRPGRRMRRYVRVGPGDRGARAR